MTSSLNRRNGTIAALTALLLLMLGLLQAAPAFADSADAETGIAVQAETGYQGKAKDMVWQPVKLTLTNRTAKDLKGELAVSVYVPYGGQSTDYVVPVELPRSTPIEVTMMLPGVSLNKDTNRIRFFEGGVKSGKEVKVGLEYLTNQLTASFMIGVVSRDPDTLNFMPTLNQKGYAIEVVPLKAEQLAEQAAAYDMLDALVLNDVPTATLSGEQVEAIVTWVKRGGTLILAGGAGYAKTAEAFADITPVKPGGTETLKALPALESYGGKPLPAESAVTVSTGELAAGNVIVSENGLPLAAKRAIGRGEALYVAFDPSLEPFASWSGSPAVWAQLLQKNLLPLQPGLKMGYDNRFWGLQQIADMFPSLNPPDIRILFVCFLIYLVLVAPVIYLLLYKIDKREWAWWLIPAVSVATSIVIFLVGVADKRTMMTHSVQTIELTGLGDGFQTGVTAIFSPTGGTVRASFPEQMRVLTYPNRNNPGGGLRLDNTEQVTVGESATTVVWSDVPYWSTRKGWIEGRKVDDAGRFDIKTSYENGSLRIDVTNGTPTALTNVHVLMNGGAYKLGDLAPGGTATATVPGFPQTAPPAYVDYGLLLFPQGPNTRNDEFARERALAANYMNRYQDSPLPLEPVVVGFSRDGNLWFEVNGKQVKTDNVTLWVQPFRLESVQDGRYYVPPGTVQPFVTDNRMEQMARDQDGTMTLTRGELEFEYRLPEAAGVDYESLRIYPDNRFGQQNRIQWSIWDAAAGEWTELQLGSGTLDLGEQSPNYVADGGIIRMKAAVAAQADTRLPGIGLEGKVKR